jgi:putative restriction endonuclease
VTADLAIRLAAFQWLADQTDRFGSVLPWAGLLQGFSYLGERVPLLSQQGIFKPRLCSLPLSIRTSPDGPYSDTLGSDGRLHYKYRGTDPAHRDNSGLREAMRLQVPLVYLFGVAEGRYRPVWPVFIVGDDPAALSFSAVADDMARLVDSPDASQIGEPIRAYVTATVLQRLHQEAFRERVLHAYDCRCALCRLRHAELLDAAHIVPDSHPDGHPRISNGLALCKLHHATFDRYFLTVDPEYRIRVRPDLLREKDGPMLRHGIQELEGTILHLPKRQSDRPDRQLLESRYQMFLRIGLVAETPDGR